MAKAISGALWHRHRCARRHGEDVTQRDDRPGRPSGDQQHGGGDGAAEADDLAEQAQRQRWHHHRAGHEVGGEMANTP